MPLNQCGHVDKKRTESIDSVEVDDLENIATPEMITLSAFSGVGVKDRSDALG